MKKHFSIKSFFSVIWQSICRVFQFIARIFGYKDESTYAKVIWRIFAGCATSVVGLYTFGLFYWFVDDFVYPQWINPAVYSNTHISNFIVYQLLYKGRKGRLYDTGKNEVIISGLDWLVPCEDKDTLAVISKNGKRGYINRFTGEMVLPFQYTKAWLFSEGLAAVEKDKKLLFINHDGDVMIDKGFQAFYDMPSYVFHDGYCPIKEKETGKVGLIDKKGDWVLKPAFDGIYYDKPFWKVKNDGLYGLYNENLALLYPINNTSISISNSDSTIEVRTADHVARRYDFEGNVLVDFIIDEISTMAYETGELQDETKEAKDGYNVNKIYGIANCLRYRVKANDYDEYHGLMDRNGKRITAPIYTQIEAIGKALYLCKPQGIIINDKGEVIK